MIIFYILSAVPTLLVRRTMDGGSTSQRFEFSIFITVGFVISSFALPIVMAHVKSILWGACYLTLAGNVIVYVTMIALFVMIDSDGDSYGGV